MEEKNRVLGYNLEENQEHQGIDVKVIILLIVILAAGIGASLLGLIAEVMFNKL